MTVEKRVIEFYEKVVACPNTPQECPETKNCIEEDYPPRGFTSRGAPGNIDIMIVGKNPGHILDNEKGTYSGKSPLEIVEGIFRDPTWTLSTTFHKNLDRYIRQFLDLKDDEDIFKRCVYTNLVKCSTEEKTKKLSPKTIGECFSNHFRHEVILWNPRMLLALGREVYNFLNKEEIKAGHGKPVIYIKHPSYHYRKEQKQVILEKIKTDIHKYLL